MFTLTISEESVQTALQSGLNKLLEPGGYDNPVKRILDAQLGYNSLKDNEVGKQIREYVATQLTTPEFQAMLGKAIADEMAKRAVDAMQTKK